jgi:hypothetical protein
LESVDVDVLGTSAAVAAGVVAVWEVSSGPVTG